MKIQGAISALTGFSGAGGGSAPNTAANRLTGADTKQMAKAPIRVFVYVAAK